MMAAGPLLFPEAIKIVVADIEGVYGRAMKPLGINTESLIRRAIKKYLELEGPLRKNWGAGRSTGTCKAVSDTTKLLMELEVGKTFTIEPNYHPSRLQSNIRSARKRAGNEKLAFYIARGVNEILIRRIKDGTRWAKPVRENPRMRLLANMEIGETILFPVTGRAALETYLKLGAREILQNNLADWKRNTRSGELKVTRTR